jgi:hypothetical protein
MDLKDVKQYVITEIEKITAWYNAGRSRLIDEDAPAQITFPRDKFVSWVTNTIKEYQLTTNDGIVLEVYVDAEYRKPRVVVSLGSQVSKQFFYPFWGTKLYRTIVKSFKAIEAFDDRQRRDQKQLEMQRFLKRFGELHNKTNFLL